ncbi:hypothetical protein R1sor_021425 [Riccia sorocarpa]|uniref:Uncharacterized protein n=1 Tax=Riccia sorocarpa TaxID=122646 RepID=A0ABD3GMR3_9MARC
MGFGSDTVKTIQGLVLKGSSVVHINKSFTEDFGICMGIINRYESISGARLNLQKLMIMPLTARAGSSWTANTGCSIAEAGDSFVYLGVKT